MSLDVKLFYSKSTNKMDKFTKVTTKNKTNSFTPNDDFLMYNPLVKYFIVIPFVNIDVD